MSEGFVVRILVVLREFIFFFDRSDEYDIWKELSFEIDGEWVLELVSVDGFLFLAFE